MLRRTQHDKYEVHPVPVTANDRRALKSLAAANGRGAPKGLAAAKGRGALQSLVILSLSKGGGAALAAFALTTGLAFATPALTNDTTTCDVCGLRLTSRTGPYPIVVSKEPGSSNVAPHVRVQIVNPTAHPILVGGSSPRSAVRLNAVTPTSRGTARVRVAGSDRLASVAPKSTIRFEVTYGYRLGRPGVYRFNVSYAGGDSNIVTYTVR